MFDDIQIEIRKCHYWKHLININIVHIGKISISKKISFDEKCFKYFIGYKDHGKVKPLCIMLRKINGYAKGLDETKYIPFLIKEDRFLKKYNKI